MRRSLAWIWTRCMMAYLSTSRIVSPPVPSIRIQLLDADTFFFTPSTGAAAGMTAPSLAIPTPPPPRPSGSLHLRPHRARWGTVAPEPPEPGNGERSTNCPERNRIDSPFPPPHPLWRADPLQGRRRGAPPPSSAATTSPSGLPTSGQRSLMSFDGQTRRPIGHKSVAHVAV